MNCRWREPTVLKGDLSPKGQRPTQIRARCVGRWPLLVKNNVTVAAQPWQTMYRPSAYPDRLPCRLTNRNVNRSVSRGP